MISITLVAALSTGMLMAMRTGLITLERTDARLQSNRRAVGIERILGRQLGGVMPVVGDCMTAAGTVPARISVFRGTPATLLMVSSYSMTEGARGFPRVLLFQVVPAEGGGVRLLVNESLYTGPASTGPFCFETRVAAIPPGPQSFVLADRLAYCRILYRERNPDSPVDGKWVPVWDRPNLPSAVRIEMEPLRPDPSQLPLLHVTVPIRINRDVSGHYDDSQ